MEITELADLSRALKRNGLTFSSYSVLRLVSRGGCNITQMATELGKHTASMTGIMDKLEKRKLISRFRTENDRRAIIPTVTGNGKVVLRVMSGNFTQLI